MNSAVAISGPHVVHNSRKTKRHTVCYKVALLMLALFLWYMFRNIVFLDSEKETLSANLLVNYIPKLLVVLYMSVSLIVLNEKGRLRAIRFSVLCFILFLMTAIVSYFVTNSGIIKLIDVVLFAEGILIFTVTPMRRSELKRIVWLFVIVLAVMLLNSRSFDYLKNNKIEQSTNYVNTNVAALALMMFYCILFPYFLRNKRLIYFVALVACVALQFLFRSRSALLIIIIDSVLCIMFGSKRISHKSFIIILLIIMLLSFVFTYYYSVVLFNKYGKGNVIIFGKDLFTGREYIWQMTYSSISDNLWFGVGSLLNEKYIALGGNDIVANAHNQEMGILAAHGLLPFIFFYLCAIGAFAAPYKHKRINNFSCIFICLMLILMYVETSIYTLTECPLVLATYAMILSYSRLYGKSKKKVKKL